MIPLSEKEELEAILNRDKEKLVRQYTPLVRKVASKYVRIFNLRNMEDDIIQEGFVGLIHAIDKFDVKLGGPILLYYANLVVSSFITKFLYDKARVIRIPRHILENRKKKEERKDLRNITGIVNTIGLEVFNLCRESEKPPLATPPGLKTCPNQEDQLIFKRELRDLFNVSTLSGIEKKMILLRILYELKFSEIGEVFGVSKQRAHQIVSRGWKKLEKRASWLSATKWKDDDIQVSN